MIQRIQTVYFLIAAFLLVLLFSNPIGEIVVQNNLYLTFWHHKIESANSELFIPVSTWPVTVLLSTIVLIELIIVFLYKKRQIQIRLCIFNILLLFGFVGLVYFFMNYTFNKQDITKSVFLWPIVCPMIAIILNYLGLKAIQKDDRLVRSYDRIR